MPEETVNVRYMVDDVDAAVAFYTTHLGFEVRTDFAPAFAIADRAGLTLVPHGGELRGPDHVRVCLDELHAGRLGHGVRSAEDPALLDRIVAAGVALEVCPVSNVALGVYSDLTSVPLPELLAAGAPSLVVPKQVYTEPGAGRSMTFAVARVSHPHRTLHGSQP